MTSVAPTVLLEACVPLLQNSVASLGEAAASLAAANAHAALLMKRLDFHRTHKLIAREALDALRVSEARLARARAEKSMRLATNAVQGLSKDKAALEAKADALDEQVSSRMQEVTDKSKAEEQATLAAIAKQRAEVEADLARLDTDVGAEEVALDDVTKKYHALVASQQAASVGDTMVRFDELEREHQVFALRESLTAVTKSLEDARAQLSAAKAAHAAASPSRKRRRMSASPGQSSSQRGSGGSVQQLEAQANLLRAALAQASTTSPEAAAAATEAAAVEAEAAATKASATAKQADASATEAVRQLLAVVRATSAGGPSASAGAVRLLTELCGAAGGQASSPEGVLLSTLTTTMGGAAQLQAVLADLVGIGLVNVTSAADGTSRVTLAL